MANTRGAELVERGLRRPARDPERDERRHPVARRQDLDPVDRRRGDPARSAPSPRRGRRRSRDRRTSTASRSSEPCRRPTAGGSSTPRSAARRATRTRRPGRVDASRTRVAAERGPQPIARAGRDRERAHALRAEQPLLGRGSRRRRRRSRRGRPAMAPAACAPSTTTSAPRAWASSAIARDRHDRAGRPQDVRQRDGPRPLVDRRVEGGEDVAPSSPPSPDVDELDVDAGRARRTYSAPMPPGCSRRVVTARSPGRQSIDQQPDVHAVGRGVGQGDVVDVGRQDRRHRGARLVQALEELRRSSRGGRARRSARSRRARPSRRPSRRARDRPSRCSGRCRRRAPGAPPAARRAGPRQAGRGRPRPYDTDDVRPRPSRASWRRPTGSREQLGPAGVRVLDARWRPDGTGAAVHAAGHIPGAVHVDWRTDLVDDRATAMRSGSRPGPGRRRRRAGRASATATTVVIYDDTQGLYAARVWWTPAGLRPRARPHPRRRLPGLGGGGPPGRERGPATVRRRRRRRSRRAARTGCT